MARVGEFQGIAQQFDQGRVVVKEDGHAKVTGFGGKLLAKLTGNYRKENHRAKAAFVQSLKNTYGLNVARAAEKTLGMNDGKPLSARQVRQVLEQHVVIHRQPRPLQTGDLKLLFGRAGLATDGGWNTRPELLKVLSEDVSKLPLDSPLLDNLVMASDESLRTLIAATMKLSDVKDQRVTDILAALRNGLPNTFLSDDEVLLDGKVYKDPVELARGAHGVAKRYTAEDGTTIVIKEPIQTDPDGFADYELADMRTEVENHRYAMKGGGSEHIAPLYAPIRMSNGGIAVAMKNCELGDTSHLFGKEGSLKAAVDGNLISVKSASLVKAQVAFDILKGVLHLQLNRHMTHLDLKPGNVFMDAKGVLQIGDFGEGTTTLGGKKGVGTPLYMAPEVFDGTPATIKSDSYSIGAMLYELYTGRCPFFDENPRDWDAHRARTEHFETHTGLAQGPLSTGDEAVDALINGLTHRDPEQRITLEEALQLPVFADLTRNGVERTGIRDMMRMLGEKKFLEKKLQKLEARHEALYSSIETAPADQEPQIQFEIAQIESELRLLSGQKWQLDQRLSQTSAMVGLDTGPTGDLDNPFSERFRGTRQPGFEPQPPQNVANL